MSREAIIKSDLDRVNKMSDEDIDCSDIPPLTDEQLAAMRPLSEVLPDVFDKLQATTVRLDEDVASWFKRQAQKAGISGYQNLVNATLRGYIQQKDSLEGP